MTTKTKPDPATDPVRIAIGLPIGAPAKLAYIQTHLSNVEKTGRNDHHKYNYMQEHGLIDLLRPYLRQLNCTIVVSPANRLERDSNRVTLIGSLTFIDADQHPYFLDANGLPLPGSDGAPVLNPLFSVSGNFAGEGVDAQDKSTNKAHTSWQKYALQKFFLVPTEHVDDSDSDDVRQAVAVAKKESPPVSPKVLAEVVQTIEQGVTAGALDPNKVAAKLATLRVKHPKQLDSDGINVFFAWVQEQMGVKA